MATFAVSFAPSAFNPRSLNAKNAKVDAKVAEDDPSLDWATTIISYQPFEKRLMAAFLNRESSMEKEKRFVDSRLTIDDSRS